MAIADHARGAPELRDEFNCLARDCSLHSRLRFTSSSVVCGWRHVFLFSKGLHLVTARAVVEDLHYH